MRLVAIACVLGCGGKDDAASTAASGSATVAAKPATGSSKPATGSAKPEKVADLVIKDALGYSAPDDRPDARFGFDKRAPILPALSADGTSVADWDDEGAMMVPTPVSVAITPLDGKGKGERLPFVDVAMAMDEANEGRTWQNDTP